MPNITRTLLKTVARLASPLIGGEKGKMVQSLQKWRRPEVIDRLKEATDSRHKRLQKHPIFDSLLDTKPNLDQYRRMLEKQWEFIHPVEEMLGERPEWKRLGFDFDERRKAHLLEQDIEVLGGSIASLTPSIHLPELETFEAALGTMYVLEGATLGATQLARNLEKTCGLNETTGLAFVRCYGRGSVVGERFKAYADFLASSSSSATEAHIIAAANDTFEKIYETLST